MVKFNFDRSWIDDHFNSEEDLLEFFLEARIVGEFVEKRELYWAGDTQIIKCAGL